MSTPLLDRLDLYRLRLQLRRPWRTAYGTETHVETIFGHFVTANGQEAWYESTPLRFPDYTPSCAAGTFAVLRETLAPLLLGQPIDAATEILAGVRGNTFARDLLVGGTAALGSTAPTEGPPAIAGITLSLHADDLIETAKTFRQRRLRAKFTGAADLPRLQQLRREVPDAAIAIDCNAAFRLPDDLELLRQLDQLDLAFIEQPLHHRDLHHHARLQSQLKTPLCLDESITCLHDAAVAVELGAARVFNLKPGRLGGPIALKEILRLARANDVACFIGGMLESPLGTLQNAHLAKLPGMTLPSDLPNPRDRYQALPVDFTIAHDAAGQIVFPATAAVEASSLAPFVIDHATLTA